MRVKTKIVVQMKISTGNHPLRTVQSNFRSSPPWRLQSCLSVCNDRKSFWGWCNVHLNCSNLRYIYSLCTLLVELGNDLFSPITLFPLSLSLPPFRGFLSLFLSSPFCCSPLSGLVNWLQNMSRKRQPCYRHRRRLPSVSRRRKWVMQ